MLGEIGSVEESRYYVHLHQISYAYLVRVGAYIGTEPTEKELSQGIETRWYESINDVIAHIESAAEIDENDDEIGGIMMHARDIAILNEARTLIKS